MGGVPQRIRFAKSIKVTAAFARTPLVWGLPLPSTAPGARAPFPDGRRDGTEGRLILREGWKGCEDYRGRITLAVDAVQISGPRWDLFGRAPGARGAKVGIIWWVGMVNPADMSCGLFSNNIHETRSLFGLYKGERGNAKHHLLRVPVQTSVFVHFAVDGNSLGLPTTILFLIHRSVIVQSFLQHFDRI